MPGRALNRQCTRRCRLVSFFSSRRRHTRYWRDWSSDVCSSDLSYRDILEFFFQIHDPTTKDRQGNDVGSDYRSEIFYTSEEQRQVAADVIADVDASGLWPGTVVTEVSEAVPFWVAEAQHQDYLQRYPNGYNCHFPRPGDRKSTRLNSSHANISYAVFCLKKNK